MKLSQKFSHFTNKNALFLVAGKQDAVFYRVQKGNVDKILSFAIPRPKYSDNEGIFQKSTHGRVQSGSVEIHNDEPIINDFLHELKKKTKEISGTSGTFSDIYIFAPSNTKNKIQDVLPTQWKKKVTSIKEGNYFSKSPVFLLDIISKQYSKPFTPVKKQEKQILKTAELARRTLRTRSA